MKRSMTIAAALCLSLLSLSGCGQPQDETTQQQPDPALDQSVQSAPDQTEDPSPVHGEPSSEETAEPEEPVYEIPSGVWLAGTDVGYSNYYYFDSSTQSGCYVSLDYGLGMSFSYHGSGTQLVFQMELEDNGRPATLEPVNATQFTLNWQSGLPETLTFVSEGTLEDFHFYTNDELAQFAMDRYAQETETPPSQYGTMTNEDNTVTVQLYDNLGDHNSTSAWYIVDRFTATGTDLLTGEEIDLLAEDEIPVEEDAPAAEEESQLPVDTIEVPIS